MNVTIRKARESDRKYFDWQPYRDRYDGPFKPWVVAVDGIPYVIVETHFRGAERVVYQNGSEAVADMLRMFRLFLRAVPALYEDQDERRSAKTEASLRESMRKMREAFGEDSF